MRALILAVLLLAFCSFAASQESKSATLYVEKIYCEACAATVKKALRGVPGVSKVAVDVDKKEVVVQFDPAKASIADLTAATAKRGFPATMREVRP